jgi:polyhydroxybutyrate depolymerase
LKHFALTVWRAGCVFWGARGTETRAFHLEEPSMSRCWMVVLACAGCGAMGDEAASGPLPFADRLPEMATGGADAGRDADAGSSLMAGGGTATSTVDAGLGESDSDAGSVAGGSSLPMPPPGPCQAGVSGSSDRTVTVMHGGLVRTANVHLPSGWNGRSPRPVVLNFHGRNSTPSQQNLLSGMNTPSDREGFIAVHPQGVANTWNAGLCCGEAQSRRIDDVGFVSALLDSLKTSFCVDDKRVYATGLSNGGFLSHRLGCELSGRIAAIAPVAGTNLTTPCTPARAVPVLHFHGTADAIVSYGGFGGIASVDDTMAGWARRNGCATSRTPLSTRGDVTCEQWPGCRMGARVHLCRVQGGGHQWPGGFTIPGLGANTMAVDASAEAWAFFEQHALP